MRAPWLIAVMAGWAASTARRPTTSRMRSKSRSSSSSFSSTTGLSSGAAEASRTEPRENASKIEAPSAPYGAGVGPVNRRWL